MNTPILTNPGPIPDNPWVDLPYTAPFVLDCDKEVIIKHNLGCDDSYAYDLSLHPEPFLGSLLAPIYLLALNPGRSTNDALWHSNHACLTILRRAAIQSGEAPSLYYLKSEFDGSPGALWWHQKTKHLIKEFGVERTAESLCAIQCYPYHSRKFSKIPAITKSTCFTQYVVRHAIKESKLIVLLRSWKLWSSLVPELSSYHRLLKIKNPLNPCLSPNNLGEDFFRLQSSLRR